MHKQNNFFKNSILLLAFLTSMISHSQSVATYTITFTSVWNSSDHGTLPSGAHWSKLVGANHNSNITFLEMGQNATQGIENVAELGNNTIFNSEVDNSITNGNTEQYIDGNDLSSATGTITLMDLEINKDYPLLTLVSMIAPSPDWMIVINSFSLLDGGNNWKDNISIDLFPYDAGTDDGTNYTSPNNDTNPQDPISSLQGVSPFNSNKIGTLTISLDSVLNINEASIGQVKIFPNPTKGQITISNIQSINLKTLEVYNIIGSLVTNINIKDELNTINWNLDGLQKGVYLLRLNTYEGNSKTQKLIIN
ncbi:MAG: spondin domain-containing protein [Flavobacteriaceae bacterium]|nr:spondin domain-containing protein [Flavobacteriaceae bacterium]